MRSKRSCGSASNQSDSTNETLPMPRRAALRVASASAGVETSVPTTRALRPRGGDRQRHRTRTGAEVEHASLAIVRQASDRELDQQFGLGTRNQHIGRDLQIEPVEFAPSDQVGDRLAVAAAASERIEGLRLLGVHGVVGMRREPCAVAAEHVREQQLRLERDEAAHGQRAGNGEGRAHRNRRVACLATAGSDAHNVGSPSRRQRTCV